MAISSLQNTNTKRQAGPDAPHEGRIRGPVVTNSCDCAVSLFTTIIHAHFSDLKMPSIERRGRGWNILCRGQENFYLGLRETHADGMAGLREEWSRGKLWACHLKSIDARDSL